MIDRCPRSSLYHDDAEDVYPVQPEQRVPRRPLRLEHRHLTPWEAQTPQGPISPLWWLRNGLSTAVGRTRIEMQWRGCWRKIKMPLRRRRAYRQQVRSNGMMLMRVSGDTNKARIYMSSYDCSYRNVTQMVLEAVIYSLRYISRLSAPYMASLRAFPTSLDDVSSPRSPYLIVPAQIPQPTIPIQRPKHCPPLRLFPSLRSVHSKL